MSARWEDSTTQVAPHPAARTLLSVEPELAATVVDERTDEIHRLNSTAAAVWAVLDRPTTVAELVEEFASIVGLDPVVAAPVVAETLGTMWESSLLRGSPEPEVPDRPEPIHGEVDGARPLPRAPDP